VLVADQEKYACVFDDRRFAAVFSTSRVATLVSFLLVSVPGENPQDDLRWLYLGTGVETEFKYRGVGASH
jgi:hypothetical protein